MSKDQHSGIQLNAEIGTDMTLEIAGLKSRLKLPLIGLLKNNYLVFHLPATVSSNIAEFKIGATVNIRSISRGLAFGFQSSILKCVKLNESVLFLSYPKVLQTQKIRKSNRVKCLLPATLIKDKVVLKGTVADLSRGGCHFQAKKEYFKIEEVKCIQVNQNMEFSILLPGVKEEQKLQSSIVNISISENIVEIGLAFKQVDDAILKQFDEIIAMSFDISPL